MIRRLSLVVLCVLCTACGHRAGHSLAGSSAPAAAPSGTSVAATAAFQQQELAKLALAPTPAGVDPALWRVLTARLGALVAESGKTVRSAPTTPASAAQLSMDGVTHQLSWGYSVQGDYDQNGEVNASDLQPLGVHFGQTSGGGAFPYPSVQAVIDGDSNGELNGSDLQSIGVNFGRVASSYNIYSSASFADYPATPTAPNGAGAVLVGSVAHAAGTGQANQGRLQYNFDLPAFAPGTFYWVRPTDGSADGTPSNSVSAGGGNNVNPLAVLQVTPDTGDAPLPVHFDASASSDPDGANQDISDILQFQWDFDGDGTFDQTSAIPTFDHTYQSPGTYHPVVRVTDQGGATGVSAPSTVAVGLAGNLPPVPDLQADKTAGHADLLVTFDATGTTDDGGTAALTFDWDFDGDGVYEQTTGNVPAVTHTYSTAGTFQMKLRVTDAFNLSATATLPINVGSFVPNIPPKAVLNGNVYSSDVPFTLKLDTSKSKDLDGVIVKYELDTDGDGTYDLTDSNPIVDAPVEFTVPGTYYPKLQVTDDKGATSSALWRVNASDGNNPGNPTISVAIMPLSGPAPLDVTFDASATSFNGSTVSDYAWDWDNDQVIDEHTSNPVIHHVFADAGSYTPILWPSCIDGYGNSGQGFGPVVVTDPGNSPPTAHVVLTPVSSGYPTVYVVDASSSTDSDGTIKRYEWDFDGDGVYDLDSGQLSYVTHSYWQNGNFTIGVRITDNDLATDTANSPLVQITQGWQTQTVAALGSCDFTSPLIEHYDDQGPHQRLLVASCDYTGNYWPHLSVGEEDNLLAWDNGNSPAQEKCVGPVCLLQADGLPGLAFTRAGNPGTGGLSFVRAQDTAGTMWAAPLHIDSSGEYLGYRLQALDMNGTPALAILDKVNFKVRFTRANQPDGSSWSSLWQTCANPSASVTGIGACVLASGKPGIGMCDYNLGTQEVKQYFEGAADNFGTMWFTNATLTAGPRQEYSSGDSQVGCCLADGRPAMCFKGDAGHLLFVQSSDATGSAWPAPTEVIPPGSYVTFQNINLLVRDGKPLIICRRTYVDADLIAVPALDADGATWGPAEYIDTIGTTGKACTATTDGTLVMVSYYDDTHGKLRVATR